MNHCMRTNINHDLEVIDIVLFGAVNLQKDAVQLRQRRKLVQKRTNKESTSDEGGKTNIFMRWKVSRGKDWFVTKQFVITSTTEKRIHKNKKTTHRLSIGRNHQIASWTRDCGRIAAIAKSRTRKGPVTAQVSDREATMAMMITDYTDNDHNSDDDNNTHHSIIIVIVTTTIKIYYTSMITNRDGREKRRWK